MHVPDISIDHPNNMTLWVELGLGIEPTLGSIHSPAIPLSNPAMLSPSINIRASVSMAAKCRVVTIPKDKDGSIYMANRLEPGHWMLALLSPGCVAVGRLLDFVGPVASFQQ